MTVGAKKVDRSFRDVDPQRSKSLNRVDKQGHPPALAQLGESVEIVAKARGKFDVRNRQHARLCVHRRGQILNPNPAIATGHGPQTHPSRGKIHPGVNIGRILIRRRHDVVAVSPGKALGDKANSVRRAADKGEFVDVSVDKLHATSRGSFRVSVPTMTS